MTAEPLLDMLPSAGSYFPQRPYHPGAPLCFVHVAKAAGTSVRLTMENAFPGERTYPVSSRLKGDAYTRPWDAQAAGDDFGRFEALSAHAGVSIGDLLAPDANLFTWLREPEDRVVSAFFFFVVQERQRRHAEYIARLDAGERLACVFLDWLKGPGVDSQQAQLAYGMPRNHQTWRERNPGVSVRNAALSALRRMFFIGLMEDHERSLDALCAITSILPPASAHRRNSGTRRPKRIEFTADERAQFDEILAPDRALYALASEIYERQMAALAERGRTEPALALIGHREALRRHILHKAADWEPVLTTWQAWDAVLGENLDARERLVADGHLVCRWRWTGNSPDTVLYFRLPRRTAFELRIRLAPATPPEHARHTTLRLSGVPAPLVETRDSQGRIILIAAISGRRAEQLPELAELHIHTARMLDESTLVPYAGARMLGIAIESISAVKLSPAGYLWRRLQGWRHQRSLAPAPASP